MDFNSIIRKYYDPDSKAYTILVLHSSHVAEKAVTIAKRVPELNPDIDFIYEASMIHDIGIIETNAPELGCYGTHPYLFHGFLGRQILETEGHPVHALLCERHTGAGITAEEIKQRNLGLPVRDMTPVSIEEQIICFADKFFSKNPEDFGKEKPFDDAVRSMEIFGETHVKKFKSWADRFGV